MGPSNTGDQGAEGNSANGQPRTSVPEMQPSITAEERKELQAEIDELKTDSLVKDKYIMNLIRNLEHLHGQKDALKEEAMFKSKSLNRM